MSSNCAAWEALQLGQECPSEELADWWPKFVHRFRPAEKLWQRDGPTILRRDWQAQHMFGDVLIARDYLAERIAETRQSTTANAPLYPELFGPTKALDVLMIEFYRVAAATTNVGRMKWWRGSVWAQERKPGREKNQRGMRAGPKAQVADGTVAAEPRCDWGRAAACEHPICPGFVLGARESARSVATMRLAHAMVRKGALRRSGPVEPG